jgi:hypothetical protein
MVCLYCHEDFHAEEFKGYPKCPYCNNRNPPISKNYLTLNVHKDGFKKLLSWAIKTAIQSKRKDIINILAGISANVAQQLTRQELYYGNIRAFLEDNVRAAKSEE